MSDKEKRAYTPKEIEQKWQAIWKEKKTFRAIIDPSKPKYYILDMFPYPSGAGLHVGHVVGYTGTDILARYKRQRGFNVLHPMGWDSFGLPAEQYAMRTGTHPAVTTRENIATYRRQLEALGFSYDWEREVATSDPTYYKWTQWIFTKLYERGLAYEAEMNVNFCPALGTVLANEEVEDGLSKEGGYAVERRPLKQWILRITSYADRLLQDLEGLDWPDSIKKLQVNWIGRSEGAEILFEEFATGEKLAVFTTHPDTLSGVTFVVIAPDHPMVDRIVANGQRGAVEAYRKQTSLKSDLERTDLAKGKTGCWTGAHLIHPTTGAQIPIWVADYVLLHYGTGIVMGVPAQDERDAEFASVYSLPIVPVDERDTFDSVVSILEARGCGKRQVQYKLRDWLFSRQRYWGEPIPILNLADGTQRLLGIDELPLLPPPVEDYRPSSDGHSPLAKVTDWVEVTDPKTGQKARRETHTMPQWAGSCWYYLRFCDPRNTQQAWSSEAERYWMPVDMYVGGAEHAVLHLLYARFWHKVLYDCGLVHTVEPFQALRNQGLVTARSYRLPRGGYLPEKDVVEREGHFFAKESGEELTMQADKMSKSKLNGLSPDEVIEEYGADTLRLYEMFMGPFDAQKVWNHDAMNGCRRFLNRFFDMVVSEKVTPTASEEALRLTHRLLDFVTRDIEAMQFNTAIARMMEFLNAFIPLPQYPISCLKMAVQALYPFAPHIAEELWSLLGETHTISYATLPAIEPRYLIDATSTYVVQVNGKLRGRFDLPKGVGEKELLELVRANPEVEKHLVGEILRTVFVPDKLLNIVMK